MQYEYIWGKIDYHGCDAEFKCLLLCRRLIINGGIVQDARQEGVLGAQGVLKAQHQCQQNTVKRDPPATGEYCLQHEWLQLELAGDSEGLFRRVDQLRLDQPDALALRSDCPHYDEALQCILLDVLSKHKGCSSCATFLQGPARVTSTFVYKSCRHATIGRWRGY